MDLLSGHENDVNYVQFRLVIAVISFLILFYFFFCNDSHCLRIVTSICSGCAVSSKVMTSDSWKEENTQKFRNFRSISILMIISFSYYVFNKLVRGSFNFLITLDA
jgi:hypothetical protein